MSAIEKADVYSRVTNKIIADLEKGELTWRKPWSSDTLAGRIMRPLRQNGMAYQGINIIMLWASAIEQGFTAPMWMTLRQANELGGKIQKGSRGSLVVYADKITKQETNDSTGETEEQVIPFMKGYTVFNVEQIDGLPAHYYAKPEAPKPADGMERRAELDAFFAGTGAVIQHGGNRAYYSQGTDHIQMPPFSLFADPESYYATLAHEATHWTKHETRLDRDFGRKTWGDEGYAREELVAEIGSAFLCAELCITPETREDHAAYIASWLKVLKEDKRAIFSAASHAQRAADFLRSAGHQEESRAAA